MESYTGVDPIARAGSLKVTQEKKGFAGALADSFVLAVVAAMLLTVMTPALASADTFVACVQDASGVELGRYSSVTDAVEAANGEGKTLVMLKDWIVKGSSDDEEWNLKDPLSVDKYADLTIDMNGHRIVGRYPDGAISLGENASLTLKSSAQPTTFSYDGYQSLSGETVKMELTSGGLVTGGEANYGGGIDMDDGSFLVIDGVAVAGNYVRNKTYSSGSGTAVVPGCGGGIYAGENCTIDMKNGATVQNNRSAGYGGGIHLDGKQCNVSIDGATVSDNWACLGGGGLFADSNYSYVDLENGGSINGNGAVYGGGLAFEGVPFGVSSSDMTGSVSSNETVADGSVSGSGYWKGGGIYVNQSYGGEGEGTIEGITLKNNHANQDGAAIYLDQNPVTVKNCTITGNTSGKSGAAVYVEDGNNTLEGCIISGNHADKHAGGIYLNGSGNTIVDCTVSGNSSVEDGGGIYVTASDCTINGGTVTENWCASKGDSYEGGGVFVGYSYDIKMTGTCIVKGNTRGYKSGNADDVMLREGYSGLAKAYITGSLAKGSSVGVRTGIMGDRRIAKSFASESQDCFFIDLDDYFVSYGTDEGGDAWQRHATIEFAVKVNGVVLNRYKYKDAVTVNGEGTDASKVFKRWNAEGSTGLYPFSEHISDDDLANPTVSFTMPQNDVNLVADYVKRAAEVRFYVDKPVAGGSLPATGTIAWEYADNNWKQVEVAVSWLEKNGDSWNPASGAAKYGANYAAVVSVDQDIDDDRAFALDIDASRQQAIIGGRDQGVASASVDASGRLTMRSNAVATAKPEIDEVDTLSVEVPVGTSADDFLKMIPATVAAKTDADTAVTLSVSTSGVDFSKVTQDGKVVKPADGSATFGLPVSYAGNDVTVPSGMTAQLTVTVSDAPAATVKAPEVSPAAGIYSTSDKSVSEKFVDGKLKVTAECGTKGAKVRYSLLKYGDGVWSKVGEDADWPSDGLLLGPDAGKQAGYKVEVWAVKDGVKSARCEFTYVIDDTQPAEKATVTVKQTDTGVAPKEETLAKHEVEIGQGISIVAPARSGYNFEKWIDADGKTLDTDANLKLEKVAANMTAIAVYNPVVSALDVTMDLPEADKALATGATKVRAKIGGSDDYIDVTDQFVKKGDKVKIAWSPTVSEDGKAEHAIAYIATMSVAPFDGGVKYVFSPKAEVKVNGKSVSGGAYVVDRDGKISVCVVCPVTGSAEYKSTATLADVELTYKEALAAKEAQSDDGLSAWGLPGFVGVTYACGESEDYPIAWTSLTDFDESATGEQELTATGTITFPDYVDRDGLTETVTVRIKVAAPKKNDGDDSDKKDDAGKDDDSQDDAGKDDDSQDDAGKGDGSHEDGKADGDKADGGGSKGDAAGANTDEDGRKGSSTKTSAVTTAVFAGGELAATGDRAFSTACALAVLGLLAAVSGFIDRCRRQ